MCEITSGSSTWLCVYSSNICLGYKSFDVFSASFLSGGPNMVQEKLYYKAYVESNVVGWNLSPHNNREK